MFVVLHSQSYHCGTTLVSKIYENHRNTISIIFVQFKALLKWMYIATSSGLYGRIFKPTRVCMLLACILHKIKWNSVK